MSWVEQAAIGVFAVYLLAAPYLAAWLALRLCSRNWGCVARKQGELNRWHERLEAERGARSVPS